MKVKLTNPALDKGINPNRMDRGSGFYSTPKGIPMLSRNKGNSPTFYIEDLGFRLVRNK